MEAGRQTPAEVSDSDAGKLRAVLLRKESRLRAELRDFRGVPGGVGGTFRLRTWILVWLAAAAACFVISGHWHSIGNVELAVFSGLTAAMVFMLALYHLVVDLATPSAGRRRTPEAGLMAFFRAIRRSRFEYAWHCLIPPERLDPAERFRPEVPELDVPGRHFPLDTLEGFRRYWRPLAPEKDRIACEVQPVESSGFEMLLEDGDVALAKCDLTRTIFDSPVPVLGPGILIRLALLWITSTTRHQEVEKLMRRIDGQWYLYSGEFSAPEDRRAGFEEALRVSKLSDQELGAALAELQAGDGES